MDRLNILITGGNGYIAKSLYSKFKQYHNVTVITRKDFNLTEFRAMNDFFQGKYFDVVIHTAVNGGSRLKLETWADADCNLTMYYNLLQHKLHYGKLIHFGTGAEIHNPESPYGLSKRVISKSISELDNFYDIRIYAVFDENELDTRFIKANIKRYINKEPMIIHQNKTMDFFYMQDLISLVEYYIINDTLPKQIDCSYNSIKTLYDITKFINDLDTHKVEIIIEKPGFDRSYDGYENKLLNFIGLERGIRKTYEKLKK